LALRDRFANAGDVTKFDAKRDEIADRLADFVLAEGLPGASLRPLAAAAGMSDRMLLYYFKDKDEIIAKTLGRVVQRLAERLMALSQEAARPADALESELCALITGSDLWPFMCVWLETASLAARGDPLFRSIGGQIARGFKTWIAGMLAVEGDAERDEVALRILRTIEGTIVLHGIGL
jgi:AcrR family transcriptional regulator